MTTKRLKTILLSIFVPIGVAIFSGIVMFGTIYIMSKKTKCLLPNIKITVDGTEYFLRK